MRIFVGLRGSFGGSVGSYKGCMRRVSVKVGSVLKEGFRI